MENADNICNVRAADARLPGTYMAWLSDTTSSPSTRFPTQSTGPYVRTDDVLIALNWDDLTSGEIQAPIDRTELGTLIDGDREAWTNTTVDGTPARTDPSLICNEWTSGLAGSSGRVGATAQRNEEWTDVHADPCNSTWRLYCFQQS